MGGFNISILRIGLAAALAILLGTAARAAAENEAVVVPVLAPGTETRPVSLRRVGTTIQTGTIVGSIKRTNFCLHESDTRATEESRLQRDIPRLLYQQAAAAGFKAPSTTSLFAPEEAPTATEYELGALITKASLNFCYIVDSGQTKFKGRAGYTIEWQIFSKAQNRVVATVTTDSDFADGRFTRDGGETIILGAVTINVRKLLASPEFRTAYTGAAAPPEQIVKAGAQAPYFYSNANNGPATVADGVGDVVTIFTDGGMGSGFMVGSEGLLITNAHVVGSAKYVKVRWPDGIETVGEVMRSHAKRDVALVKTDSRGRSPLRLSMTTPQPGVDVYAIGTPLDEKYQNTVTRGIVSANRVFDGLSYIQSDVMVNHGNSGGPLLDKNGAVIGLTVSGRQEIENISIGLNLFIPIRDAFDFLALQPAKAAPAPKS